MVPHRRRGTSTTSARPSSTSSARTPQQFRGGAGLAGNRQFATEPAGDRRWPGSTWRERGKGKVRISLGEKKSKGLAVWEFG